MPQLFGLHHKHTRLYLLMCFTPVFAFSCLHILQENYILSAGLFLASLVFGYAFITVKNNEISNLCKFLIIGIMWCNLAMASYIMGIHGIIYSFPCIIALFFLTSIRKSIAISTVSTAFFLTLTLAHGDELINLRIMASLFLTIAFSAFFAYSSKYRQQALDDELRRDPLTDMRNRYAFNEWLERCKRSNHITSITLVQLDLDNFRIVNDALGFDTGDRILKQLACKLKSIVREQSIVKLSNSHYTARCSGDVFTVGMANLPEGSDISGFTSTLQKMVAGLTLTQEHSLKLTSSIGVVCADRQAGEFPDIIGHLDIALRQAKKHGKSNIEVFNDTFASNLGEQKSISTELSKALQQNQFHMVFMPIYKENKKSIIGAELLLRCDREELQSFGPDKYIPVAENCGLINQIDFWVLNESFKIISSTPMLNITSVEFYSINISSHQLHNNDFVDYIQKLVKQYDVSASLIKLEITETSLVETDVRAIETLVKLKRLGFHLSLDDFGTGFTSFNQLKKYPLDSLKIDRSFVSGDNDNNLPVQGMSDVILSIAKLYNFKVIAEGVETENQYRDLQQNGCQYFQGYLFSKPLKLKEFVYLLSHSEG